MNETKRHMELDKMIKSFKGWQIEFVANYDDVNSGYDLSPQPGILIQVKYPIINDNDILDKIHITAGSLHKRFPRDTYGGGAADSSSLLMNQWAGSIPKNKKEDGPDLRFLEQYLKSWSCWMK